VTLTPKKLQEIAESAIDSATADDLRTAYRALRNHYIEEMAKLYDKLETLHDINAKLVDVNDRIVMSQDESQIAMADAIDTAVNAIRDHPEDGIMLFALLDRLAALSKELRLRAEDRLGKPRLS
jgi:hypothetical protein